VAESMVTDLIRDLALPRTDAGVAVQWLILAGVTPPLIWWSRRDRDVLLLVSGVIVMTVALFALRAVH